MNSKKFYWIMAAASALALAGCGDDASSGNSLPQPCGGQCTSSQQCVENVCKDLCGSEICGENQVCEQEQCKDKTPAGPEDPCKDKVCGPNQICEKGECKDQTPKKACDSITCADGKVCLESIATCVDAECVDGNAEKKCDDGQMCVKGQCMDDGCVDKQCGNGEQCIKGICEETACLNKICDEGTTCQHGNCVDNACLGMTCDDGKTCSKGDCVFDACVGKDACSAGKTCNVNGECEYIVPPALVIGELEDTTTDENGDTAIVSLQLSTQPSANVTVTCTVSDEKEAEVDCSGILFNADNFDQTQTLTIIGLPDDVVDGDKSYQVTITTVSEDPDFNGLTKVIELTNHDVNKNGVTVSASSLTTSESDTADSDSLTTFTVSLSAKPASDVAFAVSSSNPKYGEIKDANNNVLLVTFTPDNWNQPQTITLVGLDDDGINQTPHTYQIVFSNTTSSDPAYNDLAIAPIDVLNIDNDKADLIFSSTLIETQEGKDAYELGVRLSLDPGVPVSISIVVMDEKGGETDEAKLISTTPITFNSSNYNQEQIVSIQGLSDNIIDGDQNYKVRFRVSSDNDDYHKLGDIYVKGVNHDVDTATIVTHYDKTTISENEESIEIAVTLSSIPTSDVTISFDSSDKTEMTVARKEGSGDLVFTADNWNKPQILVVTGINDYIIDGDVVSQLTLASKSGDENFNELNASVDITTIDDDKAEIIVAGQGAEIREDSGETLMFTVSLASQPSADVTIKLKSSDESEIKLVGQNTISFTPDNWDTPKAVSIRVQDDSYADGTQTAWIDLVSTSEDENYNNLKAQSPIYSILDNESAGITLTLSKTLLQPNDYTTELSVSLSAPPVSALTVALNTSNANTAALEKSELVFTPENWNVAQKIKVTDKDPMKAPSAKSVETISAVGKGEGQYNNLKSNNVSLTLYAFKTKTFDYTGAVQTITLLPGRYQLEVWGASGAYGWEMTRGGYGGYAKGTYTLAKTTTMGVAVGGQGVVGTGGFNGGGPSGNGPAGGGASHIALSNRGELKAYASYQSEVLIVAGGGGGSERCLGGGGGGVAGDPGDVAGCTSGYGAYTTATPKGGTQTAGGTAGTNNQGTGGNGSFGVGGIGHSASSGDNGPGGGGGWYGGGGMPYYGGGGGGSGHLGTGVTGSMTNGVKNGHGQAIITLLD